MRQQQLRTRIQALTWVLILGTLLSGITALPLQAELDAVVRLTKADAAQGTSSAARWLVRVRDALHDVYGRYPFVGYGTDWLGFAHVVIAIAFAGALNHPLRNGWLFSWGMIASVLVVPWALILGEVRHIPVGWRLIDCSFGVIAFIPCWLAARACKELEMLKMAEER